MKVERRLWFSHALGHDMEYLVYGHDGQPVVAFPSQNGRCGDFEAFGMVGAVAHLVDAGRMRLVAADGIDWQSWTNASVPPGDRARRHIDYDRYLADELFPAICDETGRPSLWATGCSMGAFHAANAFFRHPDLLDGLIAISGLYQPRLFVGDYTDDAVYFNSPLYYLPNLADAWYLDSYRRARIVFCIGQGAWEEDCLADHRAMQRILESKGVPAEFDYWGFDVDHDWPAWRRMLPYWLERLGV
ncbi:MAG: esterase family protein [Candidatus Limnocylindria bacterium]